MINIEQLHPQFITDTTGQKKSVVLSMADFQALIQDVQDLAIVAERREESTTSHSEFINELKSSGLL